MVATNNYDSTPQLDTGQLDTGLLNRGGDRDANSALHTIAVVRYSHDERTKKYVARRIAQGKTKREAMRCLKRYIAREVYRLLVPLTPALDKA